MKRSIAGTEDKNDVLVELIPLNAGDGIEINVISPVKKQFGRHIEESVSEVLNRRGVKDVKITVRDKKALDFALKARLETAIDRAGGEDFAS